MTAAEYQAEAASLAQETAEYVSLTAQHTLMGAVFAYNQPLPTLTSHRTHREWETSKETT